MFNVLLVDDERNILNLLRHLITLPEVEIVADTQSSSEALDLTKKYHPDAIITDIRMPGLSGLDLVKSVKKDFPDVQFIMISGYQDFEYAYTALKLGVSEYLLKPVRQSELNEALAKLITEKQGKSTHTSEETNLQKNRERRLYEAERKNWLQSIVDSINGVDHHSADITFNTALFSSEAKDILGMMIKIDSAENQPNIASSEISQYIDDVCTRIKAIVSVVSDEIEDVINRNVCFLMIGHHVSKEIWNQIINRCNVYLKEEKFKYEGRLVATISIGSSQTRYEDVGISLIHARQALTGRIEFGCGKVLYYNSKLLCVNKDILSISQMQRYLQEVRALDFDLASLELKKLFDRLAAPDGQGGFFYSASLQILENTTATLESISDSSPADIIHQYDEALEDCSTKEQLLLHLQQQLNHSITLIKEQAVSKEGRLIRMAKEFVNENYHKQIGLKETADVVALNPIYFSAIFKEQTGENFTTYVQNVRISKAKELLRDTNITVKKIAEQVGYLDEKYFSKLFLKATGVKPLEYRKYYS